MVQFSTPNGVREESRQQRNRYRSRRVLPERERKGWRLQNWTERVPLEIQAVIAINKKIWRCNCRQESPRTCLGASEKQRRAQRDERKRNRKERSRAHARRRPHCRGSSVVPTFGPGYGIKVPADAPSPKPDRLAGAYTPHTQTPTHLSKTKKIP